MEAYSHWKCTSRRSEMAWRWSWCSRVIPAFHGELYGKTFLLWNTPKKLFPECSYLYELICFISFEICERHSNGCISLLGREDECKPPKVCMPFVAPKSKNHKKNELRKKIQNGNSLIKWQNQKIEHIKRMVHNCHIPDLVQASFYELLIKQFIAS